MARKRKTRKKHKKGGAHGEGNESSIDPTKAEKGVKMIDGKYGFNIDASKPAGPIIEFSQGRYFNKNVEDGKNLPESQQPCLICHNTEGPLINKGAYDTNVRIRKCANCKSLFHRRCLARYFSVRVCDGLELNCPICKKKWPSEHDVNFLLKEERARMQPETQQPQPIEQQLNNIEIPVPGNRSLAGRFCRFIGRRTRALRDGTFFGTRRRNNAVVPRGPLDPVGGRRKTRKRKNKRKRTRKVKRRKKRRRKKSKKVRRK